MCHKDIIKLKICVIDALSMQMLDPCYYLSKEVSSNRLTELSVSKNE